MDNNLKTLPMDYCLRMVMAEPCHMFEFLKQIKLEHFYEKSRYKLFDVMYDNYDPETKRVSPLAWQTLGEPEKKLAQHIKASIPDIPKTDLNKIAQLVKNDYKNVMAQNYIHSLSEQLQKSEQNIDTIIRKAIAQLDSITKESAAEAFANSAQGVDAALADLEQRIEDKKECIRTPFLTLDHLLSGGLERGEFVVIASMSNEGKSMLAFQFALAFTEQKLKVCMMGLEMEKEEYSKRGISTLASDQSIYCLNLNFMKRPNHILKSSDDPNFVMDQLGVYARELRDRSLFYLEPKMINIDQFKNYCELAVSVHKVDVIFLDHMLLVSANMEQPRKVEELSVFMKSFATENNIIFVSISQMTRGTDLYNQSMSNMAGGRAIEHQATTILSIGKIKPKQDPTSLAVVDDDDDDYRRRINILKARSAGRDTHIMAMFEGVNARFKEILPINWETARNHEPQDLKGKLKYES
jgi:replicative DNA helicase